MSKQHGITYVCEACGGKGQILYQDPKQSDPVYIAKIAKEQEEIDAARNTLALESTDITLTKEDIIDG